ncbi:hypothetical protein THF1C08_260072 [Vibrio jasicida]|uniref:Uncharacterized protein n=1 Tax=Vibrio jasicida TaxID=766224 RepID=A0AAU9QR11_9VIBR|nr:hypothetical protein THF1C08_260072 [Vibrio jasicida]CAH1596790.1 hypothetical protein THF1A12_300057 [Vibrio jasicida]
MFFAELDSIRLNRRSKPIALRYSGEKSTLRIIYPLLSNSLSPDEGHPRGAFMQENAELRIR